MKPYSFIVVGLLFLTSSCSHNTIIAELRGWEDYNRETVTHQSNDDYMTDCIFFQIENAGSDTTRLKKEINNYLDTAKIGKRIEKYAVIKSRKYNDKTVTCLFYKKKFFSSYSYDLYQSENFGDFGEFYDEKNNLIAYALYENINGKTKRTIHFINH